MFQKKAELEYIQRQNVGKHSYVECAFGRFDLSTLQNMLRIHTARKISAAVKNELEWFAKEHLVPQSVQCQPPASSIRSFQRLLYSSRYDQHLSSYNMSPDEMAKLCCNLCLSDDHLFWFCEKINSEESDAHCCMLTFINNVQRTVTRRHQERPNPKRIIFFVNVGHSQGKTFMASNRRAGCCHWTVCYVDSDRKVISYGDTLGWEVPEGLLEKVELYIKCTYGEENYRFETYHDPKKTTSGRHKCGEACATHYPVQSCASVCGVIAMVMAAIAVKAPMFFQHMTKRYISKRTLYLHVKYLRN